MMKKPVRIWNSEIAYRIDSQLKNPWDRIIFAKLLTQNELDEGQLRNLLGRWLEKGNRQAFCEFLVETGLVSIEIRRAISWRSTSYDPDHESLHVSLTMQAKMELKDKSKTGGNLTHFVKSVLAFVFAKSAGSKGPTDALETTDEFDTYATVY